MYKLDNTNEKLFIVVRSITIPIGVLCVSTSAFWTIDFHSFKIVKLLRDQTHRILLYFQDCQKSCSSHILHCIWSDQF